jgi:hypothetical protein
VEVPLHRENPLLDYVVTDLDPDNDGGRVAAVAWFSRSPQAAVRPEPEPPAFGRGQISVCSEISSASSTSIPR